MVQLAGDATCHNSSGKKRGVERNCPSRRTCTLADEPNANIISSEQGTPLGRLRLSLVLLLRVTHGFGDELLGLEELGRAPVQAHGLALAERGFVVVGHALGLAGTVETFLYVAYGEYLRFPYLELLGGAGLGRPA